MAIVTRLMLMLVTVMLIDAVVGQADQGERGLRDDEATLRDRVQLHNIVRRAAGANIVENQQEFQKAPQGGGLPVGGKK